MSVLVLAADHDLTVDRLVVALQERDAVVHRINTRWFPTTMSVTARTRGARWTGTLRTAERVVDLETVTAVYYRSPETFDLPDSLSEPERRHVATEAKYGIGGVLASLPVRWIDHPSRQADAAYKPLQLVEAARAGLRVPDSVITNDPASVTTFAAGGRAVTKSLAAGTVHEDGRTAFLRTRVLDEDDLTDLRGVEHTCHLVQRWADKAYEARVVVIGPTTTGIAIHARSRAAYVDWRRDYDALDYAVVALPSDVVTGIGRLMARFGLNVGALDFVVGSDGSWTFLELNATGVVDWLEAATGEPFTARLADLLLGRAA